MIFVCVWLCGWHRLIVYLYCGLTVFGFKVFFFFFLAILLLFFFFYVFSFSQIFCFYYFVTGERSFHGFFHGVAGSVARYM